MIRLARRVNAVELLTDVTVRYRGRERPVIIAAHSCGATVRLQGTRTPYLVPWVSVFELGARLEADRARRERKQGRQPCSP
jgi:hypothetical protein